MARRTKPAAVASAPPVADSEPPAAGPAPAGYSESELTKAFEIIRRHAMVLRVRSRVAAAALGVPPDEFEAEPPRLRAVDGDARHVELESDTAALRDAQAALDRRAVELGAREERIASTQLELDAARHELAQLAARLGKAEADLARSTSELEHERVELAALRDDLAAERRELAHLQKDATKRLAEIHAHEAVLQSEPHGRHAGASSAEWEDELKAQLASIERERQALKEAERARHARETELAAMEAALSQRETAVERE